MADWLIWPGRQKIKFPNQSSKTATSPLPPLAMSCFCAESIAGIKKESGTPGVTTFTVSAFGSNARKAKTMGSLACKVAGSNAGLGSGELEIVARTAERDTSKID